MKCVKLIFPLCLLLISLSCSQEKESESKETSTLNLPENLEGVSLEYTYDMGNAYHVKMDASGLRYRFRTGSKPDKWWGPFDYNVLKTSRGDYVIAWFEKGYGDYITLTVNFEEMTLIGSGIVMPNEYVHFDRATIEKLDY